LSGVSSLRFVLECEVINTSGGFGPGSGTESGQKDRQEQARNQQNHHKTLSMASTLRSSYVLQLARLRTWGILCHIPLYSADPSAVNPIRRPEPNVLVNPPLASAPAFAKPRNA